jgi:hypothetical protein
VTRCGSRGQEPLDILIRIDRGFAFGRHICLRASLLDLDGLDCSKIPQPPVSPYDLMVPR